LIQINFIRKLLRHGYPIQRTDDQEKGRQRNGHLWRSGNAERKKPGYYPNALHLSNLSSSLRADHTYHRFLRRPQRRRKPITAMSLFRSNEFFKYHVSHTVSFGVRLSGLLKPAIVRRQTTRWFCGLQSKTLPRNATNVWCF